MMQMFLRHQCKHGKYFNCLKCGHRHSEDKFKKLCHKDHTKEYQKMAKEADEELKKFMEKKK